MAKDKKKNDAAKDEQPKKAQKPKATKSAPKKNKGGGGKSADNKRNIFGKLFDYLVGVRAELKRVVWPTRQKVVYLVGVVVVTLIFFATFTALIDWGSSEAIVGLDSLAPGSSIENAIPGDGDMGGQPIQVEIGE
ncbi:MAG: preprotein translocase subunit SecE [Coriobacteriia bacterium]|nr:preprotein translocase subunit SecE [Coriobacteriia bacterium]